ncbi:hypothetical protein GCM10007079_12010 [Nocardiopsis terrae]|uniref:HEAT repeat-containing protein n=1 Tax=Nocardiopsis terrae TaxID=372655 RepID=A0ABR9HC28_9ACTN|nr:hypothetical protein [Nocardiopsis terrae]MBE1456589.1 hypothetical protein [Nocardiopsis terrae]GHC76058.1 hypothetical protein GCM10007079_12010 [Nocardiopsis terrae]
MAFETATYTDVTAGEAIDGVDGFNFQAVSAGLTGVDQQRIREGLLHRVVPTWALGHDALDHPPTCAFEVRDGRSYLARGRSTGVTNSGRPGNQVTQVIATSDPDDFVPYRPAQLYGALQWNLEKASGPEPAPWVTPLEVRPEFEVDALQEMVGGDEWAARVLPQYLTMIDASLGSAPTKTVLLHTDLDEVMRWIALGTLFVESERARTLQFRALVDDPWRVDAALVGVSPEFGAVDLGSANVLDLVNRSIPDIEPSDAARARAALFIEHDAAEALTAVEVSRRWEPVLGAGLAQEAARLVGVPDSGNDGARAWRTAVSAIDRLAEAGLEDDLALYGEELSEAAVTYGPTTSEEFALAGRAVRNAHGLGLDEVACAVLLPVLEALTAVPALAGSFARELSGARTPVEWESAEERAEAGKFLGTVLASAPKESLPDLFGAAGAVGAPVTAESRAAAAENLAGLWLTDPELGRDKWRLWLGGQEVAAATARRLREAFHANDGRAVDALLRGDWDFLARDYDSPELRGWIEAGKISRLPPAERRERITAALSMPAEAWLLALDGSEVRDDPALWASWVSRHGYTASLVVKLRAELEKARTLMPALGSEVGTADWGRLLKALEGAPEPRLAQLSDDYVRARAVLDAARSKSREEADETLEADLLKVRSMAPFLLADIGRQLLRPDGREKGDRDTVSRDREDREKAKRERAARDEDERERRDKLVRAVTPWGPAAIQVYLVRLADHRREPSVVDRALRLLSDPDRKVSDAADAALTRIAESQPDLIREARGKFRLRSELDGYLRGRLDKPGDHRRGTGRFSWGRGR